MYVADKFRRSDPALALRLLRDNPFALLVTQQVDGTQAASHLPIVPHPETDFDRVAAGDWRVLRLAGHMARANPQWDGMRADGTALIVFAGPHGYISPTAYRSTSAAPTWNYAAVHVRGRITLHRERDESLQVLRWTVAAMEKHRTPEWHIESSMDYVQRILPGIVSFDCSVEDVDYQFKLSQDKPSDVQRRVRSALASSDRGADRDIARLMAEVYPLGAEPPGDGPL